MSQPFLPMDVPAVRAQGNNTTTFTDNMRLPVHRWFRYSAGFSAGWAETVVEATEARRVLDPFGGSGTTVLAAEAVGAEAVGVDVHPFVTRVARAKLAWRSDPEVLLMRAADVRLEVKQQRAVAEPTSPLVVKCFPDRGALLDLLRLRDAVERLRQGDDYDELLWLAFISIIRACSPAGTAQWQYVLPNKTKARVAEPVSAFESRVELFAQDMFTMRDHVGSPRGQVYESDARTLDTLNDGWADLVLTSPPYANNFDYADATRLEQSVLGEVNGWGDLKPLRKRLMRSATQHMSGWDAAEALESPLLQAVRGELTQTFQTLAQVKQERGGKKAYDLMVAGYFFDSAQIFQALRRVSAPGVTVCYVVGDSAPYGVHVPVERWLGELALASGFRKWRFEKVRDRNTKWKNRKHTHPLHEGRLWIEG
ncbi:DNA modification methyltransferase [Marmoricola endophyticus]|uniref:site-specific DNA-methyltransferase (cytosine-N(4)-specific) n=1 Tax=Marmoricola endophyticus TaxID=2040280 RepID=A0A917F8P3_9ACTN|nr:DNA methyltransferase [Marmoricola endophyticus]GGF56965.1 DNA modification methyltransferase [Marmoricola endophyticus]